MQDLLAGDLHASLNVSEEETNKSSDKTDDQAQDNRVQGNRAVSLRGDEGGQNLHSFARKCASQNRDQRQQHQQYQHR